MSTWEEYRFSELLVDESISYGIVQPGAHTEIDSVPIIRVKNIKNGNISTNDVLKVASSIEEKYKRTRLSGGELLITVVGSVGECAIVPTTLAGWNVARAVSVAKIKENFDKRFVEYTFKTEDVIFQIYGNTNDTVQPTLNLSSLKEIRFSLPPLPEQKAIASVLSSLDDKIDLLYRQNITLEDIAETFFRQWFVEDAQEDWEQGVIKDIIEILSGFAFKSSSFVESGKYRLITIKGVQDGYLDKTNAARINDIPSRMPNYCFLQNRDILLSLTGNVGRCCLVDSNDLLLNQRVAKLQPKNSRDWAFTYILFRQIGMRKALENLAKGTAQANLSPIEMANMKLPILPEYLLEKCSKEVTPLLEKIMCNKTQIQTLAKLRDTLLPKLMSGEVRVEHEN